MVQKSRVKAAKAKAASGIQKGARRDVFHKTGLAERKRAPKARRVNKIDRDITAKITQNIEKVLASRVVHAGGTLRLIKVDGDTSTFDKSGPRLSAIQVKVRANLNARRKAKADAHQAMIADEIKKKLSDEARERKEAEEAEEALIRAQTKPKLPPLPRYIPDIDEDDVAGPFFIEETKELLGLTDEERGVEKSESTTSKEADKKKKSDTLLPSQQMLARKSGFKGVVSKSAAKLLEEGF